MQSISKITENYISEHPNIKYCVKKNIVNYSALARMICLHHNISQFDAVLIACRRFFWKIQKEKSDEEKIIYLVKSMTLRIRNKMIVGVIEKPRFFDRLYQFQKKVNKEKGDIQIIEGENTFVIVTNQKYEENIKKIFKLYLIKINKHLVQINMIFDKTIEITPGVVAHLYGMLSERGINIREEMSCWTDVMIIIDDKDLKEVMDILS